MVNMWTFVSLAVAAVPGVVAWWTGRRLLARRDDPALPERIVARANRLVQVMAAALGVLLIVSPHTSWMFVLPLLGLYVGGFPTHKVLHEERWGLARYLLASGRWWAIAIRRGGARASFGGWASPTLRRRRRRVRRFGHVSRL